MPIFAVLLAALPTSLTDHRSPWTGQNGTYLAFARQRNTSQPPDLMTRIADVR
jgi:hypothetical protein